MKFVKNITLISLFIIGSLNFINAQNESESRESNLSIDYKKTFIVHNKELDTLKIKALFINSGLPERYNLITVISKLTDGNTNFVDQEYATSTFVEKTSEININYKLSKFLTDGDYLISFRVVNPDSGYVINDFLPVKEFNLNRGFIKDKKVLDGKYCQLYVNNDISKKWGLLDGVDVTSEENLSINCDTSGTDLDGEYVLNFQNVKRNIGASELSEYQKKNIKISSSKLEFDIFKSGKPQAYDFIFFLTKDNERVTPIINAHYVIQGDSATIHTFDYSIANKLYNFNVGVTGAATNFPDSRKGDSVIDAKITVSFLSRIKP